jgi:hypothetical protein
VGNARDGKAACYCLMYVISPMVILLPSRLSAKLMKLSQTPNFSAENLSIYHSIIYHLPICVHQKYPKM